jgi:HK97 family phage portal protein
MGFMDLFRRKKEEPKQELRNAGSNWMRVIIDGQASYPTHIYRGALGLPGVWRAAMLIANQIGSLPWQAFQVIGDGDPKQIYSSLLDQPSPPETRMNTLSSMALDLLFHGNAIAVIATRDAQGYPTSIIPVPAEQVGVRRVDDDFSGLARGEIEYTIGTQKFGTNDVVHIKGPCEPGALRGFGVLEAHFCTLELGHALNKVASKVSKNGVPSVAVTFEDPDMTQAQLDQAKLDYSDQIALGEPIMMNKAMSLQPLAWNPTELQLIEARTFSLGEIANIFEVPPSFLGAAQASGTYANVEQEAINLIKFSLAGHIARFEQTLSQQFPRGTYVKVNLAALLKSDTKTQYETLQIAVGGPFMTPNEARAKLELGETPGGDKLREPKQAAGQSQEPGKQNQADNSGGEGGDTAGDPGGKAA